MKKSCRIGGVLEVLGALGVAIFVWQLAAPASAEGPPGVKFSQRCLMVSPNEGCAIADVNRDGKPDLERIVIGDQGHGHGFAYGDVNGDGREDLLLESGWYERPEKDIFEQSWKFHPETALPHPSCPFLAVDVNGDGRTDLVWGKAHDYGLFWWEQGEPKPDGATTWKEHLIDKFNRYNITEPGSGVGAGVQIRVADLNGDGRLDIAVAGKTGTWLLTNEGPKR